VARPIPSIRRWGKSRRPYSWERVRRFELLASTLGKWRSTADLYPHGSPCHLDMCGAVLAKLKTRCFITESNQPLTAPAALTTSPEEMVLDRPEASIPARHGPDLP
jgi:hypothetical protein